MVLVPAAEVLAGVYLGLIAAVVPGFIAFAIGFGFKYFTDITVPGLGVVALGSALAGVSGGLLGLLEPEIAESWTGITAILVILMACLWAHSQGDKLAAETPRQLTLSRIRSSRLSIDFADRVDPFGQIRIRPIGTIEDIEGYPPLSEHLREELARGSWRFPGNLSVDELEQRLETRLLADYELSEAVVTLDARGRAQIAAAPTNAGLSRRVPAGKRAVTIKTLLPTGVGRGDVVSVRLPEGDVTGQVVSARTTGVPEESVPDEPEERDDDEGTEDDPSPPQKKPGTTTGGDGEITIVLAFEDARRLMQTEFAPTIVHSRGKQREYAVIGLLKDDGNVFRYAEVRESSEVVGASIGELDVRGVYGISILAIRRSNERTIAPTDETRIEAGDELLVVGKADSCRMFAEVAQ